MNQKTTRFGDRSGYLVRMLGGFFIALLIPTITLMYFAYDQMKWEVYHQYRLQAEVLLERIDNQIQAYLNIEEARNFSDYRFLKVSGDPAANKLIQSPLSTLEPNNPIPGLVGYFQIGNDGQFSSPLIPDEEIDSKAYGIDQTEMTSRQQIAQRLTTLLQRPAPREDVSSVQTQQAENQPLAGATADTSASAGAADVFRQFDEPQARATQKSRLGNLSDLTLGERLEKKSKDDIASNFDAYEVKPEVKRSAAKRERRKEQAAAYEFSVQADLDSELAEEGDDARILADAIYPEKEQILAAPSAEISEDPLYQESITELRTPLPSSPPPKPATSTRAEILVFESEIGPLDLLLLDDAHIVFFRYAWRNSERFVQGFVVDKEAFIEGLISLPYTQSVLGTMSDLLVAFDDRIEKIVQGAASGFYRSAAELSGDVLLRSNLSSPLNQIALVFTVTQLPLGTSLRFIASVSVIILLVLVGGCVVIYRFARSQIALYRQQQDFVSAVSHELKTPLTSIRMYSEMLDKGWADEKKKPTYYNYIFSESERLSRLIGNVLQLARMNRAKTTLDLKPIRISEIISNIRSKITSLIEASNFELYEDIDEQILDHQISVDHDALMQVVINIVDNAIKFSRDNENKKIDFTCRQLQGGRVEFSIRDYGPGIEKTQMKKIFELFYRTQNELTRETVGTGIGLALVHELVHQMSGKLDVRNHSEGAEFSFSFEATPIAQSTEVV